MGGQEHGDHRQQGQHQVQGQADLGHPGQVDAQKAHVLAELGDGGDLCLGKALQQAAVAGQHLGNDGGVTGNGGKGHAGGSQGLTGSSQGSGADVEDPLQRVIHHADNAEHHQEVQQHGQAAGSGLVAVVLLQLHQLFLLLFRLILVLGLDVHDHGLESGHLGHALLLAQLQGDLDEVDQQGKEDDVPAIVGEQLVDPLHDIAQGPA